jgi:hypothetical protein
MGGKFQSDENSSPGFVDARPSTRILPRMLTMLERTKLLIIDDWGPEPLSAEQRRDLLEIVDEKGSLLITSQVPVSRWHELMGDPTIGDAILDRVVHRAHRLELSNRLQPRLLRNFDARFSEIKMIKRQMYGRANLDLLRARLCPS